MKMKTSSAVLAMCLLGAGVVASGCSVIVDGAIQDRDGGNGGDTDGGGGGIISCTGMADGTMCGGGRVCIDEACEISECGDGVVDPALGEECDDQNDVPGDGCEDNCDLSCEDDADCDDELPCNGQETCGDDNTCVAGTQLGNGASCTQPDGAEGVCREVDCVAAGCGNSLVADGEECDDGNTTDGDGCDADCTYSCETDAECDDGSVCTGSETCDVTSHVCVPGTNLECDDASPCTTNQCDDVMGCVYPLIDMDGDGYASLELGACGTDCNDMRDDVSPGAVELCGDALDSDCNGDVNPASTPDWFPDCDDDGYAQLSAVSLARQSCSEPPASACGGGWTTRLPVSGDRSTYDCRDTNATVRPSQTTYYSTPITGSTSYDYNCDGTNEKRYPDQSSGVLSTASCTLSRGGCVGLSGWTTAASPACGATGQYSTCLPNCILGCTPTSCIRTMATRTQSCR